MSDNYEHKNPYSLTASYLDNTNPSELTAPYDLHAVYDLDLIANYVKTTINTRFNAEISGSNLQPVDNNGYVEAYVNCGFISLSDGIQDINHIVGVSLGFSPLFRSAQAKEVIANSKWLKALLKVSNDTFFYDKGLTIGSSCSVGFERNLTLSESIHVVFDKGFTKSLNQSSTWQESLKARISKDLYFDEPIKARINHEFSYQEMIRKRQNITYSHEVAQIFEKKFSFDWDKGLELVTKDSIAWDKAKAIHYRKHPIHPWPKPELPKYESNGDLNFICLCHEVDSHNLILNFGADDCIPAIPNKNWWYILNTLSVKRLDNGVEIQVYDGNYSTDRSRWCWSYSLTVPESELPKLEPINAQPVILQIIVNGNEHHMLLENRNRSRQFAKTTFILTGRSQTALLSEPYAEVRSFLQENERTAVQLCQAELDRVFSNTLLNWQLIDELGWVVANNSLSYSNLAPMAVIKIITESGGGFVYSEKNSNTLSIKPLYKKAFWDSLQISDYERLVPESIVLNQSTDYELYPDYNGITLTNDRGGQHAQVRRRETSADVLLPPENNPLFNHVSMGSYGKSKLAKAGMVETHTFSMPISTDVGECAPGEILAFNTEWWGIVDSISVAFNYSTVNQTIKVERVNHE